ncbi:metal-sulfur cluster assembly factor [Natronococcus sp. JC468]|uniref:1,2-phenylacetyl-CoA epoxidase subunit PaaD n=1 Tax=Natronococcus sp. JC468 TaxID=1961921 RepID=UPI001439441A|nr:1,2-phenylacetyl-CoA epoxidase subunit PaaD [Natronococcus sp. JC468]NKE35913.1 metal-sulfur cluster assembly factor [Natronococcus sp. JC468]
MNSETPEPDADPTPCAYTDYREGDALADLPATGAEATGLEAGVWDALYAVEDPEMPISVVDLGLVYGLEVEEGVATLEVTLTYSGCPAREMLTDEIEAAVASVEGIEDVHLELVWSPPWSVELVTERGKDDLQEFGLSV